MKGSNTLRFKTADHARTWLLAKTKQNGYCRNNRGFCYTSAVPGTPLIKLSGITDVMKYTFFPSYKYTGGATKRPTGVWGMTRGRLVDNEIETFVSVCGNVDKFKKIVKRPHMYTVRVIAALHKLKLVPIATQVVVGDVKNRFGTAIDILCLDTRGDLCVVEQKCGFAGYHDAGNGYMLYEFSKYRNSPFYQHQMQLALTAWLFYTSFGLQLRRALVVRVVDEGVHLHELAQEFLDISPAAISRMCSSRDAVCNKKHKN